MPLSNSPGEQQVSRSLARAIQPFKDEITRLTRERDEIEDKMLRYRVTLWRIKTDAPESHAALAALVDAALKDDWRPPAPKQGEN